MRKTTKRWLIAAAALVVLGLIVLAAVMTINHWDFTKLSTTKYETNTHEISEAFHNISVKTDTADIIFAVSNHEKCKVVCYEEETSKHLVTVEDDTLVIEVTDNKSWYDHIGINFGSPRVTIYLPKTEYTSLLIHEDTGDVEIPKNFRFENINITASTGDVTNHASASETIQISTSTGYIHTENISAGMLDLSVSTGNVTVSGAACEGDIRIKVSTGKTNLTDVACKNVISSGSTGNISLKNVIAAERFSIERSTGDVEFDSCDAAEIFVETDTGDVTGSLRSEKVFFITTDTGDVEVPKTMTGGRCEIATDTGDIRINTP